MAKEKEVKEVKEEPVEAETAPVQPASDEDTTAVYVSEDAEPEQPEPKPEAPPCPICGKTRGGKVEVVELDFVNVFVHIEGCPVCRTGLVTVVQPKIYRKPAA